MASAPGLHQPTKLFEALRRVDVFGAADDDRVHPFADEQTFPLTVQVRSGLPLQDFARPFAGLTQAHNFRLAGFAGSQREFCQKRIVTK